MTFRSLAASALRQIETERLFIGGSLLRIAFGIIVSSLYVMHVADREFLFGPKGLLPIEAFRGILAESHQVNVFAWNASDLYFNCAYFAGLIVSVSFTIGWRTRIVTPLFVLFTWSIYHRMPYMMDGGYRLMTILLIYLAFADLGRHLSLDARRKRAGGAAWPANKISTIFHNGAIATCMMQICCVYFFSTFYKITGETWQHGTAIFAALSLDQFNTGLPAELIRSSPVAVTLMTYGTLLYQSTFPWLVWHPTLKYAVLLCALAFHVGIAVTMGLFWFSAIMIACEVIFIRDPEYVRFAAFARRIAGSRRPSVARESTYAGA